ncbi:MAG: hypothetical protein EPN69_03230 [Rhodanobacter sp.]|nr:MAG: hypothetical protein EPN69_03230 [Rhodanobacter sp.]
MIGLYNEAIRDFPLESRIPTGITLPTLAQWKTADPADVIARLAADRRPVLINEAHHDAHTRLLTLALLPRLRALGFNYFAAEALSSKDKNLMQRGYPVNDSGLSQSPATVHDTDLDHLMLPQHIRKQRPHWLTRRNGRVPYLISTILCKTTFPCVIDAHYVDEPDDAIAVDRYAFM